MDTTIKNVSTIEQKENLVNTIPIILIVDEDQDDLQSMSEIISLKFPHSCILCASSVSEAMTTIIESPPVIALLAIQIDNENGIDLLAWIKIRAPYCQCLMMMPQQDSEKVLQTKTHADDFYFKPIEPQAFLESLASHLKKAINESTVRNTNATSGSVFELSNQMMFILDAAGRVEEINKAALSYFNCSKETAIGIQIFDLPWPRAVIPILHALTAQTLFAGNAAYEVAADHIRAGVFLDMKMVRYGRDYDTRIFLEARNLGACSNGKEGVIEALINDPLTGVLNRSSFFAQTKRVMELNHKNKGIALLFIDIDKFKRINDQHGHILGDLVIRDIAKRVLGCIKATDLIGRFSGDEFLVLISNFNNRKDLEIIAERILARISKPINIDGIIINASVSIGITMSSTNETDLNERIEQADHAMYQAKQNGRNSYFFYNEEVTI